MNGTYYQNPTFPGANEGDTPMNNYTDNIVTTPLANLPMEQSYIENILRFNKGSHVKVFVSFPDAMSWKDRVFDGTIEQAGRDHLILSGVEGKWYLIPMIYLDFVEFDKPIAYKPPFEIAATNDPRTEKE